MKTAILRASNCVLLSLVAPVAYADWHHGKVQDLYFGYDGQAVTFRLTGHSRANCTCYSSWPDRLCLDRSRITFKEEMAALLTAKATSQSISVYIDESTCKVTALGLNSDS